MALPPLIELLALLQDNTTGDISAGDMRTEVTELYNELVRLDNIFDLTLLSDGTTKLIPTYKPTHPKHVVDLEYLAPLEALIRNAVQRSGDTMEGRLFLQEFMPTEFTQAVHKGYVDTTLLDYATKVFVDAAIKAYVEGYITTDTSEVELFSKSEDSLKMRGLKASQNVVLTDDGTDITIKANVAGNGGDVRTDVDNVFDPGSTQTFDNIVANVLDLNGINVENKLYSIDSDIADLGTLISQETADRIAAINAEAAARTNAINDEESDRIQGDAVLQGQISGIISNLNDLNAFDGGERVLTDYWTLVNQDGDPLTSVSTTSTIRSFSILGYAVNMCFTSFQYPSLFSNTRFTIFFEMGSGGAALLSPLENGYTLIATPYMGQPIASFPTGQVVANELYRATSSGKNSFSININTQGANSQKVPGLSWVAIGKKL